jgi:hypothetical protein
MRQFGRKHDVEHRYVMSDIVIAIALECVYNACMSLTGLHQLIRDHYLNHYPQFLHRWPDIIIDWNNYIFIYPIPTLKRFSSTKMKFTILTIFSLTTFAFAAPSPQNAGRPVPTGSCCVANTSLKQDVCNVNGQSGRCVPSAANNCECSVLVCCHANG